MLGLQDQELFHRFRYRTLYSLGGSAMVDVYENHMLEASFTVSPISPEMLSALRIHSRQLLNFTDTGSIASFPDARHASGDSCS
jgi:hypothetical protein